MMKCPRRPYGDVFNLPEEDTWRPERNTCSFCGSIHPDDFIEAIRSGAPLTPTDKNYKVYVKGMEKFYFEHLSEEQMYIFIDLLNAKKLNIGYPGYFYNLPYFIG